MKELPVYVMFYVFPILSFISRINEDGAINYDPFWIGMLALLLLKLLLRGYLQLKKQHAIFLLILLFFVALKYIVPWGYNNDLYLKASMMDGKWVIYIVFTILWVNLYGYPTVEKMYKAGVFFSIVYIIKALLTLATGNDLSREGLLLEANYDGFMILIAYCFSTEVKNKKKWEIGVLLLATFLTLSRTGFASLFAIWIIKSLKRNIFLILLIVPVIMVIIHYGISMRGTASVENLDRFVYWEQAFVAFKHEDVWEYILGNTPGRSLEMPVIPGFAWTIGLFEEMRNLRGIYPFMFHSTYLRLAFTWGIPVAILFVAYLVKKFVKAKYTPLKLLCLITLIQCFSLSALTLPNVSILLFLSFMIALKKDAELRVKYTGCSKNTQ